MCSVREEPHVARTVLLGEEREPCFLTTYESRTFSNGAPQRSTSSCLQWRQCPDRQLSAGIAVGTEESGEDIGYLVCVLCLMCSV